MMKRASTISLITLLITALMIINPPGVSACSCLGGAPPILIDMVTNAAAIFSGKVTQFTPAEGNPSTPDAWNFPHAIVDVGQVWKGPASQTLAVSSGPCTYPFEVGKEYLIFAIEYQGQLYSSSCGPTQPLETAGEEISALSSFFSPSPFDTFLPSATVTATGYGRYPVTADQIQVRLLFAEERQGKSPIEGEQQQVAGLLTAHGVTPDMLSSGLYLDSGDQPGFYFIVNQENLPNADFNTFLQRLSEVENALQKKSLLGIDSVEVRFSLQDCTQAAAGARSSALADARTRAELLAAVAGGQRGAIVAIVEPPNSSSPEGAWGLCYGTQDEWYPIPLQSDLATLQQIDWQATLTVTFAVEERAVLSPASPDSSVTAPTPVPVSPLATPTGG